MRTLPVQNHLWKSLAASLKLQDNVNAKSELFECATLFGKVVADSLFQYDPKEKKVMMCFMIMNNICQ